MLEGQREMLRGPSSKNKCAVAVADLESLLRILVILHTNDVLARTVQQALNRGWRGGSSVVRYCGRKQKLTMTVADRKVMCLDSYAV